MKLIKESDEVYYAQGPLTTLNKQDIDQLKQLALNNKSKRCRICTHTHVSDKLHEMIIVHTNETYVRPHKHLGKEESLHLITGQADLILFNELGNITEVVELGTHDSNRAFYYRIREDIYHSLLITSDVLVFHECTQGPFERDRSGFPQWAPDQKDKSATDAYLKNLRQHVDTFKAKTK